MIDNRAEWEDLINRFDSLTVQEMARLNEIMEEFQQTEHGKALSQIMSVLADLDPEVLEDE